MLFQLQSGKVFLAPQADAQTIIPQGYSFPLAGAQTTIPQGYFCPQAGTQTLRDVIPTSIRQGSFRGLLI